MAKKGFADSVEAWARKAEAAALEAFKEAFIEIGDRVIDRTPIKTGRARGSWEAGKNEFASGEAPHRGPEAAKAELREIAAGLKIGDIATLSSTLDYIRALEYGHSKQAPSGMLRLSVQQWQQIVNETIAKVRAKYKLK